jgi:hypothetical protein
MLPTKFQFILYALQAMPLKVFWHDNDFIQVFIIVPDVGNGVGETLHFRQQYLKQNWKFSDVSTEFLDMKYSNKQSAAV